MLAGAVNTNLAGAPPCVVIVGLVPVMDPVVAVTVVVVPITECVVNTTVAIPDALVVLVADANEPFPSLFDQVTTCAEVATAFSLASSNCAVMVTVVPASGIVLEDETRYLDAGPAVILNAFEAEVVTNPKDVASKVYPVPTLLIDKLSKEAIPAAAFFVNVPAKIPAPGLFLIASTIDWLSPVLRLPNWSSTQTVTVPRLAPATALLG